MSNFQKKQKTSTFPRNVGDPPYPTNQNGEVTLQPTISVRPKQLHLVVGFFGQRGPFGENLNGSIWGPLVKWMHFWKHRYQTCSFISPEVSSFFMGWPQMKFLLKKKHTICEFTSFLLVIADDQKDVTSFQLQSSSWRTDRWKRHQHQLLDRGDEVEGFVWLECLR